MRNVGMGGMAKLLGWTGRCQWVDGQKGHQWVVCQLIGQPLPHLSKSSQKPLRFAMAKYLPYYTEKQDSHIRCFTENM